MQRAIRPLIVLCALVAGCASVPKSQAARDQLKSDATATQQKMVEADPSLQNIIDRSAGHIVFPGSSRALDAPFTSPP